MQTLQLRLVWDRQNYAASERLTYQLGAQRCPGGMFERIAGSLQVDGV
jgi:hypothetical protein